MNGARGFTIVEVLVAVLVLTVGLLGLASSAALVTRMIGEGGGYSESATLANRRMEILASQADNCPSLINGSTTEGSYSVAWELTPAGNGTNARRVRVMVTAPRAARAARVDTFSTTIPCY